METEAPTCRICFGGTEDGELIQPCSCRGSMRWVHSKCLSTWWQGREGAAPGSASVSSMRCDVCGDDLAVASIGRRNWLAQCLRCFIVECCWMQCGPPAWAQCCSGFADVFRDACQETWHNLMRYKNLLLFGLFYDWWFLGLWSLRLNPHDAHVPSLRVRHLMRAGLWLLPTMLWCGVATWAANPSLHRMNYRNRLGYLLRFMVMDEVQLQQLFITIIAVVATCGVVSFLLFTAPPPASDSNHTTQKTPPFPWSACVAVFLPAQALILLRLSFLTMDSWHHCFRLVWPAYSTLLTFETHFVYVIAVMAMNIANVIGLVINSFTVWTADLMLKELLCKGETPKECRLRRHRLHENHGVKSLLSLLQVACSIIAFQHCLLMLRSGCAARAVREPDERNNNVRVWSRFGVCALVMPVVSLLSLFYGSSVSACCAIFLWSCFILCLCSILHAPVLWECYVLIQVLTVALVDRVQVTISLFFWRDSLRSGSVTFTNRQQPSTAEPLLGATPVV